MRRAVRLSWGLGVFYVSRYGAAKGRTMEMNLLVLQATTVLTLLAGGMGIALLGSVKVPLARKLKIDETKVGGLISVFGFTMIPVMLAAGFLTDMINKQIVLVSGAVLMAIGLVLLARAKKYVVALLAVLLLSAAWSGQINVVNVIQFKAFQFKAFEGSTASVTNLANFFFGLGAFLTPLVVAFMLRKAGFTPAMAVLAGFMAVVAIMAISVDFTEFYPAIAVEASKAAEPPPSMASLLGNPILWLTAMAMFFFCPIEVGVSTWITTFLGENGLTEGTAAVVLSAFWLLYTFARLGTAFLLPAGGATIFILVCSLLCIAVLAGMVFCRNRQMAVLMVVLAGIIFGPAFPTIIAVLLGNVHETLHGRAVGIFFAIGGIGWSLIPMLIGAYAQRTSIQRGFLMAMLSAVGMTIVAILLLFAV